MRFNIMGPGFEQSGSLEASHCVSHVDANDPFEILSSSIHTINDSKQSYLIDFTWKLKTT